MIEVHGMKPSQDATSLLVRLCIQDSQLKIALDLFDHVKPRLQPAAPAVEIYQALVLGCLGAGMTNKAVELAEDAVECGHVLPVDVVQQLMKATSKRKSGAAKL